MGSPRYPISRSDLANSDLEQLFEYLLYEAGSTIAIEYSFGITSKIDSLETFPLTGQRSEQVAQHLRRLIFRNHLIYYRFDGEKVEIVRVLDSRRDHKKLI